MRIFAVTQRLPLALFWVPITTWPFSSFAFSASEMTSIGSAFLASSAQLAVSAPFANTGAAITAASAATSAPCFIPALKFFTNLSSDHQTPKHRIMKLQAHYSQYLRGAHPPQYVYSTGRCLNN